MKQNYLFNIVEPSKDLSDKIIAQINGLERRKTFYKIIFDSSITLVSASVLFFVVMNIVSDFYQSGLSEYLSLIFTDSGIILNYWQTYLMSILESLPFIQMTVFLASMWVFVWSFGEILKQMRSFKFAFYKFN